MRIAGIEFPQPLLDALHDRRLVVFAGAGVSMGPPANLPDFDELAHQISEGTGQARRESEPVDEFLRRLKDAGTDVHRLAALFLTKPKPRWDVHLPEVGDRAGSLAGGIRPLIAGPCGSGA